jgi:general secretion pathway protein J
LKTQQSDLKTKLAGFTLIELLIALSLSTLVMLLLTMGMNLIFKEWTRSSNHLDESLDKVLVLLQIDRALSAAFPHSYRDRDENKKYIFFEGEVNKITWISTVSPARTPGLTAWQLLPNNESGLEIRIISAVANNPTERLKQQDAAIIALAGYQISFEYLYVDEKFKEDTKWLKKWSAKKLQALPHAVRIFLDNGEESLEIVSIILAHQHPKIRPIKP